MTEAYGQPREKVSFLALTEDGKNFQSPSEKQSTVATHVSMTHRRQIHVGVRTRGLVALIAGLGLTGLGCSSGNQSHFDPTSGTHAGGDVTEGGSANGGPSHASAGGQGGSKSGASGQNSVGSAGSNSFGGTSAAGNAQNGQAANAGSASTAAGGNAAKGQVSTGMACDNGLDDDGDGLVDGFDPECTGPRDNAEDSFATGIPGDNRDPKWQDCFFDGNSGAGDDRCRYSTDCLYGTLAASDPDCQVAAQCRDFCQPLIPNGCDCFGCCSVRLPNGSSVDILEATTCSLANIDDAAACPRCTKSTACGNPCGECELCPGKTAADLPASCRSTPGSGTGGASGAGGSSARGGADGSGGKPTPPPPSHVCDSGEQVCGVGLPPCAGADQYCSQGCCIVTIR